MRFLEIKAIEVIIIDWVDGGFRKATSGANDVNVNDSPSKPTGRIKFYEHMDILMGRRCPSYIKPDPTHDLDNPASPYHVLGWYVRISNLLFLSPLKDTEITHVAVLCAFVDLHW